MYSDHFFSSPVNESTWTITCFSYQDPPEYKMLPLGGPSNILNIEVTANGETFKCFRMLYEQKAYSLILNSASTEIDRCKFVSVPQKGLQNIFFSPPLKLFLTKWAAKSTFFKHTFWFLVKYSFRTYDKKAPAASSVCRAQTSSLQVSVTVVTCRWLTKVLGCHVSFTVRSDTLLSLQFAPFPNIKTCLKSTAKYFSC